MDECRNGGVGGAEVPRLIDYVNCEKLKFRLPVFRVVIFSLFCGHLNNSLTLMKRRASFLAFVAAALLSVSAFAQRTVTGSVTDAATGEGLPSASVRVKGTNNAAVWAAGVAWMHHHVLIPEMIIQDTVPDAYCTEHI